MEYLPHLSRRERDRRWAGLREGMRAAQLDAVLVHGSDVFMGYGMANFRYLTQIGGHHGGFALFGHDGPPVIFNAPPHEHHPYNAWLTAQDWVDDVRPNRGVPGIVDAIQARKLERGRIGIVGYRTVLAQVTLPYPQYEALREALPQAQFTDATHIPEGLRLVKSSEELALLEAAGRVAERVIQSLIHTARPGVRENEVMAEMLHTSVASGGDVQPFIMLTSGNPERSEPGRRRYLLHGIAAPNAPTARPLERGDLVICEFHCSVAGYLSAAEFSLSIGPASSPVRRIHDAEVACLTAALPHFRTGGRVGDLLEAMRRPCLEAGLDYLELGFHGHGLASPEYPTVVYKPSEGAMGGAGLLDYRLQTSMVFGTNIDLFDPGWKDDVGLMFGDMVVVTPDGGRTMCHVPLELPEVG
jgi:Xaa-Pro aminopeptidase